MKPSVAAEEAAPFKYSHWNIIRELVIELLKVHILTTITIFPLVIVFMLQ